MTINIIEGVSAKNNLELAAYMVCVAEQYAIAPMHDRNADKHWAALNKSNIETMMKRLGGTKIHLDFTEDDPYAGLTNDPNMMIKLMLFDMVVNRKLVIYSGASDHPIFSVEDNIAFRAVHDFFAHGKIRQSFFEQLTKVAKEQKLQKMPRLEDAVPLLQKVDMSRFGNRGFLFNGRGELNAAAQHIRLAPKEAAPALFTEVVGQVSYQIVTGKFGDQKVAILPGFDYKNLGLCISGTPQEARYFEVLAQMKLGKVETRFGVLDTLSLVDRVSKGVA